ncbi:hypothetical protein EGH21_11880 [Halomicroarcula sp. F13]|uniref:Uncharacterized protein n=1 Tax=Haloarcula rubra TaxID=2487747 RepID=A0AAW4PTT5_9EURY|nr:hypothetical protein [Halomicroarcula rubra]MBX0323727.1 hypothetical protein [Halomicroarcula rubra]
MATAGSRPVHRRVSHGAVSLVAGFLAGLALFLAVGAATDDAVFSALSLALVVAVSRALVR